MVVVPVVYICLVSEEKREHSPNIWPASCDSVELGLAGRVAFDCYNPSDENHADLLLRSSSASISTLCSTI